MENQLLVNIVLGTTMTVIGWFARELWAAVKDLKADIAKLREELPKEYVDKNDYRQDVKELKDMIGKLFDILDRHREQQ